jgi:protein gp37
VESQQWADIRIPQLIDTPAAIRFISAEPLLGPIDLYGPLDESGTHRPKLTYWLTGRPHWDRKDRIAIGPHLDWVIAGGESGPNARPIHPDWARTLRDQCAQSGVAFLYKQWGEWSPHEAPSWPTGDVWRNPDRHRWVDPDTGESKPFGDFTGTDDLLWSLMHRVGKNTAGRLLDGRTWDQYPAAVNGGRP